MFGIWRWLGRQAKVEEGARTAAEASEDMPGETLFPVSLLARAPVRVRSLQVGQCIDAMAGCSSGRLRYVVVSQGGVAGVGETLRRLPWSSASVEGEDLIATIDPTNWKSFRVINGRRANHHRGDRAFRAVLARPLRRLHYPPERNQRPAHLTMFHALPPSAEGEVRRSLGRLGCGPPPRASLEGSWISAGASPSEWYHRTSTLCGGSLQPISGAYSRLRTAAAGGPT